MKRSIEQYLAIFFEEQAGMLKAINEGIDGIKEIMDTKMATKDDIKEVRSDIFVLQAAVKDIGKIVNDYDRRITHLEASL